MSKKLNRLKASQNFQLAKWWDAHAQQFEKLRQSEIAEFASRDLGFTVTANNVAAAMSVTGKRNHPPRVGRTASTGNTASGDRVRIVARELLALMKQLDVEPSEPFRRVIRGASQEEPEAQQPPVDDSLLRRFIRGGVQ